MESKQAEVCFACTLYGRKENQYTTAPNIYGSITLPCNPADVDATFKECVEKVKTLLGEELVKLEASRTNGQ